MKQNHYKHERVIKSPGPVERRQEKATRLQEELRTTIAKMSAEEKAAFVEEQLAEDSAEDDTIKV